MQSRKSLSFNYTPAAWAWQSLLFLIFVSGLLILYLPFLVWQRCIILAALIMVGVFLYHRMQNTAIQQIIYANERWFLTFKHQEGKMPVTVCDYSRPWQSVIAIQFDLRPRRKQKLIVYLSAKQLGQETFRAVSRILN